MCNVKTVDNSRKDRIQAGFTLVELAVVMTVIGLITGGVLKGQEMISNARVKATITQIHEMTTAVIAFQEIYGALPGDLKTADRSVPGCTGYCGAGNGNGIIGRPNLNGNGGRGVFDAISSQAGTTNMPEVETTWFWQHLMLTGLITGVEVADPNKPQWGVTHPKAPLPGGLHIGYLSTGKPLEPEMVSGHYIAFRAEMDGLPGGIPSIAFISGFSSGTLATSPFMAQNIDIKLDDGRPLKGRIVAPSLVGFGCLPNYDPSEKSANCLLSALIEG